MDVPNPSFLSPQQSVTPPAIVLPAGAVAGWGLHPLEKRRLVTAHVESRHSGGAKILPLAMAIEILI